MSGPPQGSDDTRRGKSFDHLFNLKENNETISFFSKHFSQFMQRNKAFGKGN